MAVVAVLTTDPSNAEQATGTPETTTPVVTTEILPSPAQIEAKLAEVEANTALDDAAKAALTEHYRRTLANLESLRTLEAKQAEFSAILSSAPAETAAILGRLEDRPAAETLAAEIRQGIPADLPAEEISQRLNGVIAEAAIEETRISELDKLIERSTNRPGEIRARLAQIRTALEQTETELAQTRGESASPDQTQARQWALESRRRALLGEGLMLDQELLSQGAREALSRARRDEATLKWERLRAEQRALEELQNQRRQLEAETARIESERAQIAAADKHPLVQQATRENAEISASTDRLAQQLGTFDDLTEKIDEERKRVEQDFKSSQQRIEAAGLSKALGQVLLDRREQLPDLRQYRRDIQTREDIIADSTLRQIRYREEQRQLRDLERYLDDLTALDPSAADPEVRAQIKQALEQQGRLIAQAIAVEDDHIRQLGELNYAADQLIVITQRYDDFLAERLLWVRSTLPIGLETLTAIPSALGYVLSHLHWLEVARELGRQARVSPLFWIGAIVIAILFARVAALRRAIRATAEPLRRIRTDHLSHTARALGLTLVAALPVPLLLGLIGLQLSQSSEPLPFVRNLGAALTEVAIVLYYLRAFRTLCIPGGVADLHFRWSDETLRRVRRELDWFTLFATPLALLILVLFKDPDPVLGNSLGRLGLVALMLGLSVVLARMLSPMHGVLKAFLVAHQRGWLNRLRYLWYPLIVGAPLALALLALAGYVYTAGILFDSLIQQIWLALALIILHQIIVRWLIITRRHLALQAAIDRAAARRAQAASDRAETTQAGSPLQIEETEPDLAALDEQTRQLINASIFFAAVLGVWLTWSDVLPAFSMLQHITLWHYTGIVDAVEQLVPVTAADLGLVLVIVFVATVAAKNLPALLEILLLHSNTVSAGGRYAIKTLASYSITVVAFLLAFGTLGLNWGQVQWLVAALSVGIGFGLQEIVANFISGIIILFERPVRVGDIVTIGDTTGVVTNIQIRATTIRNWDRQELLVPNKEFITGRLLNWSLTDQQNRISIPIGIEYGSDTRRALAILSEVAAAHERVLDDPAPVVSFEGFGDNSLTIVLRCFLESLDGRLGVITELHQAIYDRFEEEQIHMAFPQRDVHLASGQPLDIRIHRGPGQASKTPAESPRQGTQS
ncbi:MAG: mechanosensitive ion channel [Sphingobacteriia bacterium]|nr:mechanosensitive ion channel [Sphingobacteriia bacterium]NCC39494.1 mechanosensitive ion channel [Gammaproteobacteria bacterium]